MNKLEQFKSDYLSKLESEDKDKILGAFEEVENIFNETIQRRDGVSKTNRELTERIKGIQETLGLEENFGNDDIKNLLANVNSDAEKLKADISAKYEEKYSNDIQALKQQTEEYKNNFENINSKYNESLFESAIVQSGLLDDFVDESMARKNIIDNMIKPKLLYKDGKVFVKDETTGDVAMKLGTNEPYSPSEVINGIKESINPMYLKANANANGGGVPPNQSNGHQPQKLDTSKYKDSKSFMNDALQQIKQ